LIKDVKHNKRREGGERREREGERRERPNIPELSGTPMCIAVSARVSTSIK
jgi:hypothetical protein